MKYPEWLRQVSIEKVGNIFKRTNTDEPNVYVIEQDAYNFVHFFVDDDKYLPTAIDVILRKLEEIYHIPVQFNDELNTIARTKECSNTDFKRLLDTFPANGIDVYTLEAYIKDAFNLFASSESETTLVYNLYIASLSNPILDHIKQLNITDQFKKLKIYNVYHCMVKTILLYAVLKGTQAFPLQVEDFRGVKILKMYREAVQQASEYPKEISLYLDLINKNDSILIGGGINGF